MALANEDDDAPGGGVDNAWGGDPERLRALLLKSVNSSLGKPIDETYFLNLEERIRRGAP